MTFTAMQHCSRLFLALAATALLWACERERPESGTEQATEPASSTPAPTHAAASEAASGRVSRYTSLADCTLVEQSAEGEGDYSASACPGLAGYGVVVSEGDLRADLEIAVPGGGKHSLNLTGATKSGGFSRVGDKLEWRGIEADGRFRPDALILRYLLVENADRPEKETSYLLTVLLKGTPCVTGKVPPGPEQNDEARRMADGAMRCL